MTNTVSANVSTALGFQPLPGATRPRTPSVPDLEQLVARYRKLAFEANDRYRASRTGDMLSQPLGGDFALWGAYDRMANEIEKFVNESYARVGRSGSRADLRYVSSVRMAVIMGEWARAYTYAAVAYADAPASVATLAHEIGLFQSYFGVFLLGLPTAENEDLFGE